MKKTAEHAVFKHPQAAKVRKDNDGKDLYLIPRHVADEDTEILRFKCDFPPRLEDILVLFFHLKEEKLDEEMVG